MGHVCLIDGSNVLHRAWAVAPKRARSSDGVEIGAVQVFASMIAKMLRRMESGRHPPTHVAIFFDPPRTDSWRRAIYPAYKAHRPETDPALRVQIPMMRALCQAAGLAQGLAPKHEADDLIATYAEDALAVGDRVSILSGDKDLMQIVRPGVLQYDAVRNKWFDAAAVEEKFGVPPTLVRDFLAMAGDAGDGVPGAFGIGPVAASTMLNDFGSLDAILANPTQISRKGWRKIIEASRDDLELSRRLVTLDAAAPRILARNEMTFPDPGQALAAIEVLRRREFLA